MGSGGPNKGDATVLQSMLKMLEAAFPSANPTVMSWYPKDDCRLFRVKTVPSIIPVESDDLVTKFKTLFFAYVCVLWAILNRLFGAGPLNLRTNATQTLDAYFSSDLIVACTTDMLSDTYGFRPALESLYPLLLANIMKKHVAIIGTQIGPFGKNLGGMTTALVTRLILRSAKLITVRDASSARCLQEMGIARSVYVTADPAFLLEPTSGSTPYFQNEPIVGINTSALIYHYGFASISGAQEKLYAYLNLMTKIVDHLADELGANVILLPHVFAPTINDDRVIARMIFQKLKHRDKCQLILDERSPRELKEIIGQCNIFISTRMHPLIHAVSLNVPSIAICYSPKEVELMKRLGQEDCVFDIRTIDQPSVYSDFIRKIGEVYFNQERKKGELRGKVEVTREKAMLNVGLLQRFSTPF